MTRRSRKERSWWTQRKKLKNFVGGEYVDASDSRSSDLINPATGEVFAEAPSPAGPTWTGLSRSPSRAFESWRDTTPQRGSSPAQDRRRYRGAGRGLVRAESENTGKPFGLTMEEEIPAMVDQIRFFAGAAQCLRASPPGSTWGYTSFIRREPVGVCAQVTPWNYPMMMAIWKFAPAIAAGNTVVIKPSDTTPIRPSCSPR